MDASAATEHRQVEADGFEALFAAEHERMLRFAVLLCGDREEAEDAVGDVFARLCRKWPQGVADMGAYLRRSIVNEISGLWRQRGRRRRAFERLPVADPVPGPETVVGDRERLLQALSRLPLRQRAALVLRYFDDATEAATAEVLNVPVGTVKSTVARGLERLRAILQEEGA